MKSIALFTAFAPLPALAHWGECGCEPGRGYGAGWSDDYRVHSYAVPTRVGRPCDNYPRSAARVHASGVTWVRVRVGRDGWVHSASLHESSGRADLDRAALACTSDWHYDHGAEGTWQVVRVNWRWHWG